MAFNKSLVFDCIRRTRNVPEAMLLYISEHGCNGFNCKSCVLMKACDHYPSHARFVATRVMAEVLKREGK